MSTQPPVLGEDSTMKFLEVQLREAAPNPIRDSRVEIRLRNGRSLLVGPGFDAERVRVPVGRGVRLNPC
jgi:hypothetical protein